MILEQIGLCGDLKAETISILKEFCLDVSPFKINQIKDYLPQSKVYLINALLFIYFIYDFRKSLIKNLNIEKTSEVSVFSQ